MALGDPSLVRRIECGRSLTLRTADRVLAFIADYAEGSGGARDPPRRPRYRGASAASGESEEERSDDLPAEE